MFLRANSGYNSGKVTSVSDIKKINVLSAVKAFQIDGKFFAKATSDYGRDAEEEELATPLVTLDCIFYGLTVYAQKLANKLQKAGRTGFWVF